MQRDQSKRVYLQFESKHPETGSTCKSIFEFSENTNLLTLKFYVLDHVGEDKYKFRLLTYLDALPDKSFNFFINIFMKMTSTKKIVTVKEAVSKSSVSNNDILELIIKCSIRMDLVLKGFEISLEGVSTTMHPNLTKGTHDENLVLESYVIDYAKDVISEKILSSLFSDLNILIRLNGTRCGCCRFTRIHIGTWILQLSKL